jgi:hypothetical protein
MIAASISYTYAAGPLERAKSSAGFKVALSLVEPPRQSMAPNVIFIDDQNLDG